VMVILAFADGFIGHKRRNYYSLIFFSLFFLFLPLYIRTWQFAERRKPRDINALDLPCSFSLSKLTPCLNLLLHMYFLHFSDHHPSGAFRDTYDFCYFCFILFVWAAPVLLSIYVT